MSKKSKPKTLKSVVEVPARFSEDLLLRPPTRERQIVHLQNLYRVVFEVLSEDRDEYVILLQGVLEANSLPEANIRASGLRPAVQHLSNQVEDDRPQIPDAKQVIFTVIPLARWLDQGMESLDRAQRELDQVRAPDDWETPSETSEEDRD